jgi:hypothetical protein
MAEETVALTEPLTAVSVPLLEATVVSPPDAPAWSAVARAMELLWPVLLTVGL